MSVPPDDIAEKILKKIERAEEIEDFTHTLRAEMFELTKEAAKTVKKKSVSSRRPKGSVNPHYKSYKRFGKAKLAIMLFMDIVDYSKLKSNEAQRNTIEKLNTTVRKALKKSRCNMDDVICLPTGDGMCLCFTDHTKPLLVAEEIQETLQAGGSGELRLRMGIHSGGVLRVNDLKRSFNLAGDAINMTQRAMDYGDEWHILCTESAYKEFERIEGVKELLNLLGKCEVKHGRQLELYNYVCDTKKIGNPAPPRKAANVASSKSGSKARKSSAGIGN